MAEVMVEKETCRGCGVEVRDDTLFCYNCGSRIVDGQQPETTAGRNGKTRGAANVATAAASDDTAQEPGKDKPTQDKLARAAEQRRKARVGQRKPRKIVWQPTGDSSQGLILVLAVAVTLITFLVVLLTVVWK